MKDKNKLVANNIKAIRVAKQISQAEVAKALSLTPTAYNRIENNKTQIINILTKIKTFSFYFVSNTVVLLYKNHVFFRQTP